MLLKIALSFFGTQSEIVYLWILQVNLIFKTFFGKDMDGPIEAALRCSDSLREFWIWWELWAWSRRPPGVVPFAETDPENKKVWLEMHYQIKGAFTYDVIWWFLGIFSYLH